MNHIDIKEMLSAFVDNELTDSDRQAVEDHVASCDECRQIVADLEQLEKLTARHSPLGGDDAYWEESAQKIEQKLGVDRPQITDITPAKTDRTSWSSWYRWRLPAIAASVAIMIFIGINQSDILTDRDLDVMQKKPAALAADSAIGDLEVEKADDAVDIGKAEDEMLEIEIDDADYSPKVRPYNIAKPGVPILNEAKESDQEELVRKSPPRVTIPAPVPSSDNYKAKAVPSAPAIIEAPSIDQTITVNRMPDLIAPSGSELEQLSIDAEAEQEETRLVYWRRQIDSLTELQTSPRSQSGEGKAAGAVDRLKESAAQARKVYLRGTQALVEEQPEPDASEVEWALVVGWFWIGQNSPDTSEVRQATEFLRSVASDTASANQKYATSLLRTLSSE